MTTDRHERWSARLARRLRGDPDREAWSPGLVAACAAGWLATTLLVDHHVLSFWVGLAIALAGGLGLSAIWWHAGWTEDPAWWMVRLGRRWPRLLRRRRSGGGAG